MVFVEKVRQILVLELIEQSRLSAQARVRGEWQVFRDT
jgi:hypothetical protein